MREKKEVPEVTTERLVITLLSPERASQPALYFCENKEFHFPWDPPRPKDFYEVSFWEKQLSKNVQEFYEDKSARFFFSLQKKPDVIVGVCNFTAFQRGPFQCCNLGFSLAAKEEGNGYMQEALVSLIDYVFQELKIHRIQANHLPHNLRSRNLLRRIGFVVEGYAHEYLFINGAWEDHILTSLTNPESADPDF